MTKPLRELTPHEAYALTKLPVPQRCSRIIDEFDEWLAAHVVRLGFKHEDMPHLSDAFRDYFANTRTARHPDNRRVDAAPQTKPCVNCIQCGWALIEGSSPGSRCMGCARLSEGSTPFEHATLGHVDTYRCNVPTCSESGLCDACRTRGVR